MSFFAESLQETLESGLGKLNQRILNLFVLFLLVFPLLEEGLVSDFKEHSHGSEAGSLEIEVEIHVILVVLIIVFCGGHLYSGLRKVTLFASFLLD